MPLILGTNSIKDTGYNIDNSCRFNAADSAYLTRTFGSAGNRQKWTFSTWCKRAKFGAQQTLFGSSADGSNYHLFYWGSDETLTHNFSGTTTSASGLFRDPSAWYHVVCAVDTTQGTAANRVRLYVNGAEVGSGSYPDEDAEMILNNNVRCDVGSSGAHFTSHMLGGYLAETVFIDGTQYAASDFGEYDEDSPTIWKPKDVSELTFGTNGFWFDYEASGTLGNDANGGTDWTATNLAATDQATDTPTNNFATWNSVMPALSNTSFSEGNLTFASNGSASGQLAAISTMAASTGKWYAEFKMTDESTQAGSYPYIGTVGTSLFASTYIGASGLDGVGFNSNEAVYSNGSEIDSGVTNIAAGNIVGVAADFTNKKIYFHVNGTYINSGDPAAGSNGYTIPTTAESFYSFMCSVYGASGTWEANFGSPSFSISSGNADGNGYGNFEYAVPSGYLALCTKNLGSDGG